MGFCEILTIIFITCKILGVLSWSWGQVFIPMYIAGASYIGILVIFLVGLAKAIK